MKEWICEHYPHLTDMGSLEADYATLQDVIERAWHAIPQPIVDNLIQLMSRRVAAVRTAEGWYTKY